MPAIPCCPACRTALDLEEKPIHCPICDVVYTKDELHFVEERGPKTTPQRADEDDVPRATPKAARNPQPRDSEFFAQLPPDLPAKVDQLGKPRSIHKPDTIGVIVVFLLGIIFTVIGVVIWGYYLLNLAQGTSTEMMRNIAVTTGSLATIIGVVALSMSIKDWTRRPALAIFEDGLVRVIKGKAIVVPWDEIERVFESIVEETDGFTIINTTYTYTIELPKGQQLVLPGDDNVDQPTIKQLGETIQERVTRRKLPAYTADFKEGKTIAFGPVSLSVDGLSRKGQKLLWNDVEDLQVQNGEIVVRQSGKWLNWGRVAASDIPNVRAFIALVTLGLRLERDIECLACGKGVSSFAPACPYCGVSLEAQKRRRAEGGDRAAPPSVGTSIWAVLAFYLGIFSVLCIPSPLALLTGVIAVWDIRRTSKAGLGRALVGIVMGGIGTAALLFFVFSMYVRPLLR